MGGFTANIGKYMKINLGKGFSVFYEKFKPERNKISEESLTQSRLWQDSLVGADPYTGRKTYISRWRLVPIYTIGVVFFAVLLTRLFTLQILEGQTFLSKALGNRSYSRIIYAPRGIIYDREGNILASNKPAFRMVADPTLILKEKKEETARNLSKLLDTPFEEILGKLEGDRIVTIKADVEREKTITFIVNEKDYPGISVEVVALRKYADPLILAHLVGYVGQISKEELKVGAKVGIRAGDNIGKIGVEEAYDTNLRGINGYELIKVDATGKKEGVIYKQEPKTGSDLTLSLNLNLQKKTYQFLEEEIKEVGGSGGVAVVLNTKTGEILSLVSLPSFDSEKLSEGLSEEEYQKLVSDPARPFINRSISSSYPPGSTFKLVTAAAGLETGKFSADTKILDTGFITLGDTTFKNWYFSQYGKTEGELEITRAIARSNDTFFFRVGQILGEKLLQDFAVAFGLGEKTGVNLIGEQKGLVPTQEWKLENKGEPWFPGNTLNMAIGQGDLLTTPMQIAVLTSAIVNGGKIIQPQILKTDSSLVLREKFVKEENLKLIREGMREAAQTGGTAWPFFDFNVATAGKTGTSEVPSGKPHAWFTAFAPYENPEVVVTVLVEHGGEGSNVAAPVVRKILEYYFSSR